MPDFRRTKELFEQQGLTELWNKRPKQLELLDDELFEVKVISPDTKTFYQLSDLPVGYRKLGEDRKYPIRQVLQIYRIKRVDGTEWLKSRGRIVGLDKLGNEVEHSFVDPEMFYKPVTRYEFRKSDSKNENSPSERVCVEAGINPHDYRYTEYTLPFNQKNFENLYKQRPIQSTSSVTLAIYAEGASDRPRQITDPELFSKKPFDDLRLEAITPKYKLDRSYKDNLEASHIT
jgi:hypothetical protein